MAHDAATGKAQDVTRGGTDNRVTCPAPAPSESLAEEIERRLWAMCCHPTIANFCTKCAVAVAREMVERERNIAGELEERMAAQWRRAEAAERERDSTVDLLAAAEARIHRERDEAKKSLAEYREKWGHAPRCYCDPNWSEWRDGILVSKGRIDPRCAPAVDRG